LPTTALSGLLVGLSLIVAIGAQNAFVLRQGVRREHVGVVVAICAISDALLIVLGTIGVGALVQRFPLALEVLRWGGVVYLVWFAIQSVRQAIKPSGLHADAPASATSVVATTLALTYLNPHVYLDTVVMLGNIANQQGDGRWWFAGGAAVGSLLWFTALGFGARLLAKPLGRPAVWRGIDAGIAVVMLVIAFKLGTGSL